MNVRVMPPPLADRFGRTKRKLRLSLTDRCNFRCRYCMPEHPQWLPKSEVLTRRELVTLAGLFVDCGIDAIRLTGGEPLLRQDLVEVVQELQALRARGLARLSMTTNASLLAAVIAPLKAAGLDDLNISLDAVDPARFAALTRREIAPVLEGIRAAQAHAMRIKLNCVLVRGHNEDQVLPLTAWAMQERLPLRFIEYMPLDAPGRWQRDDVISEAQVLEALRAHYAVQALPRSSDPATHYLLDGHYTLGIVSTVSNPFCSSCDRLRLTARGELYTCLFSQTGLPLRPALHNGASRQALELMIRTQVWNKDAGYAAHPGPVERPITMHTLGG